MITCLFLGWS